MSATDNIDHNPSSASSFHGISFSLFQKLLCKMSLVTRTMLLCDIQCLRPRNVHYMAKNHCAKFDAFINYPAILALFNTALVLTLCSCVALVLFKFKNIVIFDPLPNIFHLFAITEVARMTSKGSVSHILLVYNLFKLLTLNCIQEV